MNFFVCKNAGAKMLILKELANMNWHLPKNAGARMHGMSYSQFMGKVKANGIELNRKVLADLAMNHPDAFKAIVERVK